MNNDAIDIAIEALTGQMPPDPRPQGGTLVDGVYHMVDYRLYEADQATILASQLVRLRYTMRISGGGTMLEIAASVQVAGQSEDVRSNVALSTQGTSLVSRQTCPDFEDPSESPYTATESAIILFGTDEPAIAVFQRR